MANCYRCGVVLYNKNNSKEHVIPNSLGGRLSFYDLICKACNDEFGKTIDAELFDQIGFAADAIGVIRDRPKPNIKIILRSISGLEVSVGSKLIPKPKLYMKIPGKAEIVLEAKDDDDLKRLARKKQKELEVEYGEFLTRVIEEPPATERLHFTNSVSTKVGEIGFGGHEYFRAIGKIMLNFYLAKTKLSPPKRLIDYVCGRLSKNDQIFLYHPSHYSVHEIGLKEISHVIYLQGDPEMGLVYCYVELFNFQKFLAIIDPEYMGAPFNLTYCYDLIEGKEISKVINININKYNLQDLKFIFRSHLTQMERTFHAFEKKLERLQVE